MNTFRQSSFRPGLKLLVLIFLLFLLSTGLHANIVLSYHQEILSLRTLFLSLVLESLPFLLLGSVISALLEVLVSEDTIARLLPRKTLPGLLVAALLGLVFPLCECGIVLIAGRLARKRVPLHLVTTFMLSVPLINPLVILSTGMAFPDSPVAFFRIAGALGVAVLTGYLIKCILDGQPMLNASSIQACGCGHHHLPAAIHGRAGESCLNNPGILVKMEAILMHSGEEFLSMGSYFVIGAFLASLLQVSIPRDILTGVGQGSSSILVMMAMAFGLSLCSNADAFVARSFASTFSSGSIMAFLIYGAMIDLKNSFMLFGQFKARYVITLMGLVTLLVLIYGVSVNLWGGI